MSASPVRWYFDFVSPFAYLQWRLLRADPLPAPLEPVPILFAAVLNHHGQKGPAEIDGKRAFTYRFVQWRAAQERIPFRFPPAHPFNPIAALRLAWACARTPAAIDAIFAHVWEHGRAGDSPEALAATASALGVADAASAVSSAAVKDALRAATEDAIGRGVFGVPTLEIDGELYWGADATGMAHERLANPQAFRGPEYERLATLPIAAARRS